MQKVLGFERYLYVFAKFKIKTLKSDSNERDFFQFLSLLEDNHGDVLDIGANIGIMTTHLSRKLPNSTIHAFEPIPVNAKVLNRIVQKFGLTNVIQHAIALGDSKGTLEMILPNNGKTKMQGLSHVKHESITEWNEGEEFQVNVDTIDNLLANSEIQGIKIDIENFEYFALRGGKFVIEKCKPIIYAELWDNDNRKNCFEFLTGLGYSIFVVADNALVEFDANKHNKQNFIFLGH